MKYQFDDFFEKKVKPVLCEDNWFSNLTYWMYKDLDCVCCSFYRGILLGIVLGATVAIAVGLY